MPMIAIDDSLIEDRQLLWAILRSIALLAKKIDGEGLSICMYLAKPLALEIRGDSMSLIEIPDFMHLPGVVTADWINELNQTSDAQLATARDARDSTPTKPQCSEPKSREGAKPQANSQGKTLE
jgi:hypothetical protein